MKLAYYQPKCGPRKGKTAPKDLRNLPPFGRLTALYPVEKKTSRGGIYWLCRCVCGIVRTVRSDRLVSGETTSCGCYLREIVSKGTKRSHGLSKSRIYGIWRGFMFHDRGEVCERWRTFEAFFKDMGTPPDGMVLGRKDLDKPFCPENCEWTTHQTQMLRAYERKRRKEAKA